MTIWVLAVVLLASLAGLGYRQGAVRVAFSFLGILFGALLAVPLGRPLGRLLGMVGLKDPLLVWVIGPLLAFVIFSVIFKIAAAAVHHKVDVYYKYHAGDLRLALWERLNRRVGLCLGLLNGAAYLVLLAFVIYLPSYMTYQVATSDADPTWMRLLNRMGQDLQSTGFVKVARSIDSLPKEDFQIADLGALIYRNPLLEARLANYPGFLGLGEQPEFQDLSNDKEFTQMWASMEPVMNLMDNPKIQAIRHNPELLKTIWSAVESNLDDARSYLTTGRSPRYDSNKILGRWHFDPNAAINAIRRAKQNISSLEMQRVRRLLESNFSKTELIAKPDNQLTLRSAPPLKFSTSPAAAAAAAAAVAATGIAPPLQNFQGQWKDANGKYLVEFSGQDLPTMVEGDRLSMKTEGLDWVFARED
jgi:hypothetical protein